MASVTCDSCSLATMLQYRLRSEPKLSFNTARFDHACICYSPTYSGFAYLPRLEFAAAMPLLGFTTPIVQPCLRRQKVCALLLTVSSSSRCGCVYMFRVCCSVYVSSSLRVRGCSGRVHACAHTGYAPVFATSMVRALTVLGICIRG